MHCFSALFVTLYSTICQYECLYRLEAEEIAGRCRAECTNRETFFYNQMRVTTDVISSRISDFEIDGITFEVGGRKKGKKQLSDAACGYVVRDDIEYGSGNVIPLWAFGLTY